MKNCSLFILLLTFWACTAQNREAKTSLDGRSFKIENFVNGKSEGFETLSFKNGKAENDVCKQWGFTDGTYTLDANAAFKYTLTSEKEGRMDWDGRVVGNTISGAMVWIKAGQDDIHYTFKGEELK